MDPVDFSFNQTLVATSCFHCCIVKEYGGSFRDFVGGSTLVLHKLVMMTWDGRLLFGVAHHLHITLISWFQFRQLLLHLAILLTFFLKSATATESQIGCCAMICIVGLTFAWKFHRRISPLPQGWKLPVHHTHHCATRSVVYGYTMSKSLEQDIKV